MDHGRVPRAQKDDYVGHVLGMYQATGRSALAGAFKEFLTVWKVKQGVGVDGARPRLR